MNRWSQEKIRQVVLLAIATAAMLAIIWFVAVAPLQRQIETKGQKISLVRGQIEIIQINMQMAEKYREEVRLGQQQVQSLEQRMAHGDLYRWVINYLLELQNRHDVVVTDYAPPQAAELKVPPQVPYKAASFSVAGNAYYHDFGLFLADLENSSPFIRLRSLELYAVAPGLSTATAVEKLTFRTEFTTLVKPTVTSTNR